MNGLNFGCVDRMLRAADPTLGSLIHDPVMDENGNYVFHYSSGFNITAFLEMLQDCPSISENRLQSSLQTKRPRV
jgi:hypothetical protein